MDNYEIKLENNILVKLIKRKKWGNSTKIGMIIIGC